MSVEEFLEGVKVLQPSTKNLSAPPLWMFLTPSLISEFYLEQLHNNKTQVESVQL